MIYRVGLYHQELFYRHFNWIASINCSIANHAEYWSATTKLYRLTYRIMWTRVYRGSFRFIRKEVYCSTSNWSICNLWVQVDNATLTIDGILFICIIIQCQQCWYSLWQDRSIIHRFAPTGFAVSTRSMVNSMSKVIEGFRHMMAWLIIDGPESF